MLTSVAALSLLLLSSVSSTNLPPAPFALSRRQNIPASQLYAEHNLSVPVDHFHNDSRYEPHSDEYFNLRYWFDASYYKQGGPVIVLNGGETSGAGRLPYLQHGIVSELAAAVGGVGVILEHRYYGTSFPVPDLSLENYRFLTTDQALADQAYFAKNVVFPGLEHLNLTAPGTPYFAYGGSYAGAFVAFLRVLYPDATWGAISSSGVTEAYYDYWQYYEPVRQYGPPQCIDTHTKLINIADKIMLGSNQTAKDQLKSAFGLADLTYDDDFGNQIGYGVGFWQSRNWDPEVNDDTFEIYCSNITTDKVDQAYTESLAPALSDLITQAGYSPSEFLTPMSNWISWYNTTILSSCTDTLPNSDELDLDSCFGYHDVSNPRYSDRSVENYDSLSWPYQYCTEWGYLQSGATVPEDRLPLISRLVTVDWNMLICKNGFNITTPSDTAYINRLGGYNIAYPRLAIIGGEADPWRTVSPLADATLEGGSSTTDRLIQAGGDPGQGGNAGTVSEPLIVIPGAVHHWDENGVFPNQTTANFPPKEIKDAKEKLVAAARSWMDQWVDYCKGEGQYICHYEYQPPGNGGYGDGGYGNGGYGSGGNGGYGNGGYGSGGSGNGHGGKGQCKRGKARK